MCHAFLRVGNRVREIIHRVHTPLVARAVVVSEHNAVNNRVAHIHIRACHINLGAQYHASLGVLALRHLGKQAQVFLHTALSVRAVFSGHIEGAAVFALLLGCQLAHICLALLNEFYRTFVQKIKVIGSKKDIVIIKAQPLDVFFNRFHILGVLFGGVSVIKAQIANALVLIFYTEIDADCLRMADVQIAVRLGRKARLHAFVHTGF